MHMLSEPQPLLCHVVRTMYVLLFLASNGATDDAKPNLNASTSSHPSPPSHLECNYIDNISSWHGGNFSNKFYHRLENMF